MRILYVEDNEVNRALVERVMRARQCSVVFEDEGEGALDTLAKDPAINLILLDIELAGSMTGLDVIRAMRARNDHRPVVAVTAYAMMGDRERFLEAGCDQYLPKPLVVTDLLNMIDHYQAELTKAAVQPEPAAPAVSAAPATPALPTAPIAPAAPADQPASAPSAAPAVTIPAVATHSNGHRPDAAKADSAPATAVETSAAPSVAAPTPTTPSAAPDGGAPSTPAPQAEKPPEEDSRSS
jgi:CheY-like chemotaxis protein